MTNKTYGVLYVVATPIGNLGDISSRAVEVLHAVDIIAAEDTRHSAKLLQHFGISTRLIAYHEYSNEQRLEKILSLLTEGQSVALISDAGTPLISDPGYALVGLARDQGVSVVPLPGACAVIAALSVSGLPCNEFVFQGFLPAKSVSRRNVFNALLNEQRTVVFYESPHRIVDSLHDLQAELGAQRYVVLARELTKTYETVLSGEIESLLQQVQADTNQQRGEFVVLVKGVEKTVDHEPLITEEAEKLMRVLLDHVPVKVASTIAAKVTGLKKRDLYQWTLSIRNGQES
ncbi:MAG: 16S rRNA (cytidine1402-2'-O)-methyltransferase [Candidatus Endobugula sp.]|jgi:16S rRNA (cytidine1402-2'-O)-methyltransferase